MALRDLSPSFRAPILGLGLGAVAGGFETIKLAATLKLSLSFVQAMVLGLTTVGLDAVLGLSLAVPVGVVVALCTRGKLASRRHALSMALTAALLAWWFLVPAARDLMDQDRLPAAVGFLLAPIGVGGVVWFNAGYWLRREAVGERRRLGWWAWSLLAALMLCVVGATTLSTRTFGGAQALDQDPSVILVTIDTLRRDYVSAYTPPGETPLVQTPVFDGLAARGILFNDAITVFPETAPSHSSMFTGLHPYRTGMLSNGHRLSAGYTTLAEVLQDEGYATAAFVSSFAVDSRTGLDQGFQVYDDELFPWVRGFSEILVSRLLTRVLLHFGDPLKFDFLLERPSPVTDKLALDWLADNADKPFFLWVHSFDVHSPYEPHGMPGFEDNGVPGAPSIDHRWILAHEDEFTYTDDARAKLRRLYAEEVAYTDKQLGIFLAQVDKLVKDRPVLLIVTSDHGEQLGEHGIEMNHHGVFEQALRVPLVVVPVRVSGKKRVVDEQVSLLDLPATVLAQLQLDPDRMGKTESIDLMHYVDLPDQVGAASLVMGRKSASLSQGTLYGYRANFRKVSATGDDSGDSQAAVEKRGRIKYILDPDLPTEQLFDLTDDPDEANDLSAQRPEIVEQMRAHVTRETGITVQGSGSDLRFQRSAAERQHKQSLSAEDRQRLQALGYLQGDDP
ncbi:MAG: sulfatase-like hydrolase/transferase [Oligoflexia bacterium]|nr:sulfatase-like hydrolase/transferase [Oligoflexia bacterium]